MAASRIGPANNENGPMVFRTTSQSEKTSRRAAASVASAERLDRVGEIQASYFDDPAIAEQVT
jgi:hypothetical protein